MRYQELVSSQSIVLVVSAYRSLRMQGVMVEVTDFLDEFIQQGIRNGSFVSVMVKNQHGLITDQFEGFFRVMEGCDGDEWGDGQECGNSCCGEMSGYVFRM